MCEDEDLCEGNGRYNIYLNTKGKKGDISFDLKEMFKYINGGTDTIGMKTKSKLVKTIDKYVQEFNSNDTWRQGAMTIDMLIRENYDQGKDEGYKDGFAQGVSHGISQGIAEGKAVGLAQGISQGIAEGKAKGLAEGKAEGLREGLQEGKSQTQIQIVKNMYSMDLPLEKITKCTGLSTDEVNKILSEK
jgi:predicted transposase/invertase (TIGR01784 family)